MSSTPGRKAELQLKKEKLQALREEKLRRDQNKKDLHGENNAGTDSNSDLRGEADAILKNFGIDPLTDLVEEDSVHKVLKNGARVDHSKLGISSSRRKNLQCCRVGEFEIKPHSSDCYSKQTQTIETPNENATPAMDYYVLTYEDSPPNNDRQILSPFAERTMDAKMLKSVDGEVPKQKVPAVKEELKEPALVELTEDQKQQMLLSEGFRTFFDRSTRIIERALCEEDSIFMDYLGTDLKDKNSLELMTLCRDFYDDHWSRNRSVVDLDWSLTYPELLLAAYSPNEEVLHEPAGCCMIWNLKFPSKKIPEYLLHASEPITSACIARFHPNLVVGGMYSGQIVLWDTRSNKRTPVQRSTFAAAAHTQPVNSVQVIGSQNAHNIISMSADGSMCAWSMEMLGQPREKIKFSETAPSSMFDLYPTCMAFFANDQNNFVIGSESGTIYTNQRHSSRVSATGDTQGSRPHPYKGHSALVTGISTHPSPTAVSFSHFFLSASLDWTVRLWSTRETVALHTFDDYSECVYGVDWSPVHPALFAAVDGTGRIDVWNLNHDVEVPTARCQTAGVSDSGPYPAAINKVKWDPTGHFIATGDDEGHLKICSVAESLATPSSDDSASLVHVMANLKSSQQAP